MVLGPKLTASWQSINTLIKSIEFAWDEQKGHSHLVSGKLHFDSRRSGDVSIATHEAGYEKGVGETNDHPAGLLEYRIVS